MKIHRLLAIVAAFASIAANAASYTWNGSASNLCSNAANWTPNGRPVAFDDYDGDGRAAAVRSRRTLEAIAVDKGEPNGTLAVRLTNPS